MRFFDLFRRTDGAARRLAVLLLAAVTALTGLAAVPALAAGTGPTGRGSGYTAVLYDNTKGLPTSDANAIVQSAEGFIWIGSYSGLIRYDGNEFYRYDSSTGMSSVVSLFVDSQGRLWIGTNDSGVFLLQGDQFTSYDQNDGLRSSSVRAIQEDQDGNILVATTMGMAYIDPEGTLHVLNEPLINREYICELVEGQDGVIFGVTNSGAFFTLEDLQITGFFDSESLGYGVINTVYPDPDNKDHIYLGTQNATVVYWSLSGDARDSLVIDVEPQQNVRCIRKLDGRLWICANNGIGYLNDGVYTPLSDLPMNNAVEHVIQDYEGNLWFTSSRQGIMKIVPDRFTDLSELAGLPPLVVNSTCLYDGLLYLGTDTGLVILDQDNNVVENDLTALLEGERIRSVHASSDGMLWFGTNSEYGLVRYHPDDGTWDIYNAGSGLASDRARTMMELSDGRIAVATNAGVNIIEDGEITALYNDDQGISNLEILCLEESPNGQIYAGSDGDGIYILGNGKVSRLGRSSGLRSEVILRMRRDPKDPVLYWIVTSNSLAFLRGDKITTIRNFPYSNNFDLFFDEHDRVWILSSNGIYVVKRQDLLADKTIEYTLYDRECGLPCAATANGFSCLDEDGTLYLAAGTGVSTVNINDDSEDDSQLRLSVPFVYADDTYIPVEDNTVRIPSSCRRLNIHAYSFSYSLNNPHLSYRLEGFDEKSVTLNQHDMDTVTYTNLPGGTYRFHLAVLNTMTGREDQSLTVTIVKDKTIYEQVGFWVAVAVLAAAIIGGGVTFYFRRKTKALLRKQAEHKELIDQMTSAFASCIDLKDPYTNGHSHRVAKYSAMLAEKLGKNKEDIDDIYHIALLHDIGKISIPDSILNKPGRLTDEEFAVMKSHSQRGYDILKDVRIAPELAIGAGYHHERPDGRGYPQGLTEENIPEVAKIISVADTFDAMYSTRPYRKQMALEDVAKIIQDGAGSQFDARVVQALMDLIKEGSFDDIKL